MPISSIKTTESHAHEHNETEVPLPLATRYGGLGGPLAAAKGDLIYGAEGRFSALEHPGTPSKILQTGEGNTLAWSRHDLILAADVKLDQSLHKAASPIFARLGVGKEDGGKVWISRMAGAGDLNLMVGSDVQLDQNLSSTSDVSFKSLKTVRTRTVVLNLPTTDLKAEDATENALAFVEGIGLAFSNGSHWIPVAGNIKGSGKAGTLSVFTDDHRVSSATALIYRDGCLGIGVGEPQAALHVGKGAIFEKGVTVGVIDEQTKSCTFGTIDGLPAFKTQDGIFKFGTGFGNLKGAGKAGHLAVFSDADDLSASHVFINKEKKALCSENITATNVEAESVKIGKTALTSDDKGRVYVDGKALCLEFKVGAIQGDFMEIGGEAFVVGGNLKIKPNKASNTDFGVAKFSERFFVREGLVDLDFDKIKRASAEDCGLLSKNDFRNFSEKADGFKKGRLSFGNGFSVRGEAEVIGSGVEIAIENGSHEKAGIVKLAEKDFIFKDGVASLRNQQITEYSLKELLKQKQDKIDFCQVKTDGEGFVGNTLFNVIGSANSVIKLNRASNSELGIAKFSNDFEVNNGHVALKKIPSASREIDGLFTKENFKILEELCNFTSKTIYGSGKRGFIPVFSDSSQVLSASPISISGYGVRCDDGFEAKILSTKSLIMLGAFEGEASKAGAGAVRYERGAIEFSNGDDWVRLRAGGVNGTGKPGCLTIWNDNENITNSESLVWNEKTSSLGIGSKAPIFSLHIEQANASLGVISTRASGPQNGARFILGSNDGSLQGQSDELGSIHFLGNGGTGAKISSYAASNWEKTSSPAYLAFAVCPDGQTTPVDTMFLTSNGYLGLGVAKPSAPLHVSGQNKSGITAVFTGGVKIGSCETSASLAGKGVLRCTQDAIQISDGERWRTLAFAD